jgi:hypothetical protein
MADQADALVALFNGLKLEDLNLMLATLNVGQAADGVQLVVQALNTAKNNIAPIPTEDKFANVERNGAAKYALMSAGNDFNLVPAAKQEFDLAEDFAEFDIPAALIRRIVRSPEVKKFVVGKSHGRRNNVYTGVQNRFSSAYRAREYYHFIIIALFDEEHDALTLERDLHDSLSNTGKFDEETYNVEGGNAKKDWDNYCVYLAIKYAI